MNTKTVLTMATLLTIVRPTCPMLEKFRENPGQTLALAAGMFAAVSTSYDKWVKFSKTEDAKQAKYEPFIKQTLYSLGIATVEGQDKFVSKADLEEVLQKYASAENVNQALGELEAKFVSKEDLPAFIKANQEGPSGDYTN